MKLLIIFVLFILASYILVQSFTIQILEPKHIRKDVESKCELSHTDIIRDIDTINENNSKIKSIVWNNCIVFVGGFRCKGDLFFETSGNLRFYVRSVFSLELDMGCNDLIFWFWAKRIKSPALYYSSYDNLTLSRLKTPFNPILIRQSIGLQKINFDEYQVASSDVNRIKLYKVIKDTTNQNVKSVLLIDRIKKRVIGNYTYDLKDNLLVSSEITEWESNTPAQITINWYEENYSLIINLNNVKRNIDIKDSLWVMPDIKPSIDMANRH